MTKKLKTLKDIEHEQIDNYDFIVMNLRNTAKEWIKKLRTAETDLFGYVSDESYYYNEGQIDWIKHFFNLEDEE